MARMVLLAAAAAAVAAQQQRSYSRPDAYARMRFPGPGLQDFSTLKFGLFIHWGPISIWGAEISFPLVCWAFPCTVAGPGNSQIVIENATALAAHRSAYRALAGQFNPTAFNASALMDLAWGAGFRYVTPTAMHCDGFALYNSSLAANYSMRATPFGRDVTGELLAAARARGMRGGVYVCPSLWNNDNYWWPNSLTATNAGCCRPNYDALAMPDVWGSFLQGLHGVVQELTDLYRPSHWWFDSGTQPPAADTHLEQVIPYMRAAAPETVVHVRDGGVWHDYVESGDHGEADVAAFIGQTYTSLGDMFEVPGTLGQQWAYDPRAVYKTAPQVLQSLIPIVAKGGNYLLNIGLDPTGVWAPAAVDTLTNLTAWFAFAGESIHDTAPMWPYQYGGAYFVQSTANTSWSYVSFWSGWNATSGELLLPSYKPSTLAAPPVAVRRLTPAGPVALPWALTEAGLSVNVSDLPTPPPAHVPLSTYFKAYAPPTVDRAPCGVGRPCSVYTSAGYNLTGVEGYCLSAAPPASPADPAVPLRLLFNGGTDNLAALAPPADGQSWQEVDTECWVWTSTAPGRAPLEVWHSAALGDYWSLASDASRAAASAAGYTRVGVVGYVETEPSPPPPPDVEAFAYVLRLEWA